jgi:hypothetical protein
VKSTPSSRWCVASRIPMSTTSADRSIPCATSR